MKELIIKKNAACHTITPDFLYRLSPPHYVSYLPEDISIYCSKFPEEIYEREGLVPVYDVITVTDKDLRIANIDISKKIFEKIYLKNQKFRFQVDLILQVFSESFKTVNRELNEREEKVYHLLEKLPNGNMDDLYDAFIISMEIDNPLYTYPYQTFYSALRRKGYSAIIDVADLFYNSYKVNLPVIVINIQKVHILYIAQIAGPIVFR